MSYQDDTPCMDCQCVGCEKSHNKEECGNCIGCNGMGFHQMWDYSCKEYVRE